MISLWMFCLSDVSVPCNPVAEVILFFSYRYFGFLSSTVTSAFMKFAEHNYLPLFKISESGKLIQTTSRKEWT